MEMEMEMETAGRMFTDVYKRQVLYSEAEEKQNMFQRGETIMRIKSMMKGMLAVVMAMSMAACSGAPASYVHELGLKFGIHII